MSLLRSKRSPRCNSDVTISVVLPIYNEMEALPILVARLAKAMWTTGRRYEIIFADDGSTDGSSKILDEMAADNPHLRVLHLSRNFGRQAALTAAMAHAKGDALIVMDSDLQDPPEVIPEMIAKWQAGYDVVYAMREKCKKSVAKRCFVAGFRKILSRVASSPILAEADEFGLIDRRVANDLLRMRERDRYFPGMRSWVGYKQIGVPVEFTQRYDDHPRITVRGLLRLAQTAVFSFSKLPLNLFHAVGLIAVLSFIGLGAISIFHLTFAASSLPAWFSPALIGSFFAALNALGISVLGEYVVRIYDQVRSRPVYLVERTVNVDLRETVENQQSEKKASPPPLKAMPIAAEDSFVGDEPYLELVETTNDLLREAKAVQVPAPLATVAVVDQSFEEERARILAGREFDNQME